MKKQNLILILIFAVIVGFMIWLTWRNEKKEPLYDPEKINIKQPVEVKSPSDYQSNEGKG